MTSLFKDSCHFNDSCLAFQIEAQDIKGRIVRLNKPLNEILAHYTCPDDIKRELGKAMALTALLGSMMKFDGIFTMQIKSDDRVKSMVSDFATDGNGSGVIRGYINIADDVAPNGPVLGNGQLMITMDQGQHMARYQGVVELQNGDLKDSAEEYFQTSEQLPTHVMISCDKSANGHWSAAAIMIQHLARNTQSEMASPHDDEKQKDDWDTATILLSTVKPEELLGSALSLQDVLMRLFHESGIRLFSATQMMPGCRCSEDKLRDVLASFNTQELRDIAEDGVISMTCEFCKTDHKFDLKKLIN
ncbi:hypothetical protein MNBD_ALPHA03-1849 [hydrothermal vent metagenome]|uniref:33 kDa chaperonin HslO n=1 Tax=hydrothermal vent metagenome TaxID=652676 RepID=A0A3B1BBM5_9ZZZZ